MDSEMEQQKTMSQIIMIGTVTISETKISNKYKDSDGIGDCGEYIGGGGERGYDNGNRHRVRGVVSGKCSN